MPGSSLADRVDALLADDEGLNDDLEEGEAGGGLIDDEVVVVADDEPGDELSAAPAEPSGEPIDPSVEAIADEPMSAPQRALEQAIGAAAAVTSGPPGPAGDDASAAGDPGGPAPGSLELSLDAPLPDSLELSADEPPARPSSTSVATAPAASSSGSVADDELSFSLVEPPAAPRTITNTTVSSSPAPAGESSDVDDEEISELSEISEISEIVTIHRSGAPPRPVPPAPPPRLPSMPPRPVRPPPTVTVPPRAAPPSTTSPPPSSASPIAAVPPMATAPGHPPPAPPRAHRPSSSPPPPSAPPGSSPLTSSAVVVTPRSGDPLDALEAKLSAWEGQEEEAAVEEEISEVSVESSDALSTGSSISSSTGTSTRAPTADPGDSASGQPASREVRASGQLPVMPPPLETLLENPTAVERAAEELTEAGAERRAEELSRRLESEGDEATALLAYELGELYERRLADEARAVKAYGRSLVLDSSYRPNLWAIRRIFYRRKLWPNLLKLIDAELRYARSEEERGDLLLEKARLLGHQLGEAAQARAALEEAVRVAPGQQVALLELERQVAKDGDLAALKEVWELLGDAAGHPARKVATLVDVARACGGDELARALSALDAAAAAAVDEADIERVARERVRLCEALGESGGATTELVSAIDKLIAALLRAFGPAGVSVPSTAVKRDEPPDRATELRLEIVALRRYQAQLLRREEPQRSWEVLQDALVLAPGEALLLGDLTDLAEELGRFEDLAELVASWQAIEGDPNRGLVLSIRRADALLRGGRRDEAKALLASLDATAPGFIVLTSAAERDALSEKDGPALAAALMRAAQAAQLGTWMGNLEAGAESVADPQAAVALYVSAAEVFAYIVGGEAGLSEAKAALGKALELRPADPAAFEASVELCDHQGDVAGALALIDRRLAETRDLDGRRALLERATRIAKSHGDLEIALATDRKLLEITPADRSLQWRVEAMLGQLGREVERAELLGTLATEEPDPTRRVMALVAAARLRERLGQIDVATELYRQALGIWPDDVFARESLADLLRAQERWAELVDERRAEARLLPDGPAARRALREAAWVLEHRIGDISSALAVYIDWSERLTDDRTALEGVARCYARLGDGPNEVAIRGRLADLEGSPVVIWEWARSLERAGKIDQAIEAYRLVLDAENVAANAGESRTGVAAPLASITLGELAVRRGDPMLEVEAIAALAQRTSSAELGAALAEEAGWRYALILDDVDRAAQSFAASLETSPGRKGALLGLGLTAAKRNDLVAQGGAFESLAAAVTMPEAAGALHLRAAAMASAMNDSALAQRRVTAAWSAAHEDVSALVVAAETWELPEAGDANNADGSDGIVDALLARAEVLERRAALADDPPSRAHWELDLAEVLERAGRLREAGDVVAAVLRAQPDDVRALVALRRMSHRAGDKKLWADASYGLARQISAPPARLALLRDAIGVYDGAGPGEQPASLPHALATYRRMFEADAGMPELVRYLELIRQSGDVPGLLAALSVRLEWIDANQPAEAGVAVLLERATVRFGSGDQLGAITDLDDLLGREPAHLEALRFRADLALLTGDAPGAADRWRRCLDIETRPERRADIELALARVLSEEMSDVAGAIEQMVRVVAQNPGDLGLRERLFGLYARISDWDHGARELRELIRLRPTAEEKARDEHRLATLLRDKVGDRLGARLALDRGRNLDPLNLECIRELADLLDPPARQQMLASAADRLREVIAESPTKSVLFDRLAAVLGWQSDVDGRWLALTALEAVGSPTAEQRQVLAQGRGRAKAGGGTPKRLDAQSWVQLTPPMPTASGGELWRAMASAVTASINLDAQKLGFGRGERVPIKKLADRDRQLAAAFATFGLSDVDLFISDTHDARAQLARVLSTETPVVCLGREIAAAASAATRFAQGRALALAVTGYGTLAEIRDGELERFVVAALRAAEATVPSYLQELVTGEDAALAERTRLMKKHLSRKDRTTIGQLALRGDALADVAGFRRAALGAANRAGLLWCGDLSVALAAVDAGRGARAVADNPSAVDLVVWSVSTQHLTMREELGIGLGGAV